jgi:outer membrane protein TolC
MDSKSKQHLKTIALAFLFSGSLLSLENLTHPQLLLAQQELNPSPETILLQRRYANDPAPFTSEPSIDPTNSSTPIELTLPDTILLLLQHNYDLKNATLARIVQRQELREAESVFDPKLQPSLVVGVRQTLSESPVGTAPLDVIGKTTELADGTRVSRGAQVAATLKTPVGTDIAVTVNPLWSQGVGIRITQPLLRGFGIPVNMAPVNQARLTDDRNLLDLQNTVITQITQTIIAYRNLIRAQEFLRIQRLSLEDQKQQQRSIQVLVEAGRRARFELVEVGANIATTETAVLDAENVWRQAKSDLLRRLDLAESLDMRIPESVIDAIRQAGEFLEPNTDLLPASALTDLAYANRPDYRQAQLDIQIAQLGGIVAQDNQHWSLNFQTETNIRQESDISGALILTRSFGDQSRNTAVERSRIDTLSRENDLANLTQDIRLEVEDRLRDLASARDRIGSTRIARELAEERLKAKQVGRTRGNIFEILQLQNNVAAAQNDEVRARIDWQDALSRLEETIGITLDTWKEAVDTSGVFVH